MQMKTTRHLITALAALGVAGSASSAVLTWDDGGDGVSVYQEANWTAPDGVAGTDPAADAVNGNLGNEGGPGLIFDFVVGGTATAGGAGGAGPNFDLSDGTTLTVQDDATFRMGAPGIRGQNPFDGLTRGNVVIQNNGTVITTYSVEIDFSLMDSSILQFKGAGNPVNESTIDLAADWAGELQFLGENIADAEAEHLSKITVNGAAAVLGTNVQLVDDGNTGSILTLLSNPFDPADLDQDGDVDDADFGIAFAAFTGPNNGPSSNPAADLDGDGDVDDADFGIAFAAFTGPNPSAAVPEPTSLALLALGGLAIARRRRA